MSHKQPNTDTIPHNQAHTYTHKHVHTHTHTHTHTCACTHTHRHVHAHIKELDGRLSEMRSEMKTAIKDKKQWREVKSGIPHKSVLAPIMFLTYVNDMTWVSSYISLFADDAKLLRDKKLQRLRGAIEWHKQDTITYHQRSI